MKTFNNNNELKQELIKKLQHHQDLDAFIQGTWLDTNSGKVEGDTFKGCFYGCTMQTDQDPIEKFSEKYDIDLWYCSLTEKIFEGLPKGGYEKFPLESIKVLPVGVDINKIKSLFHYKILESQLEFCKENKEVTNSVLKCMELFKVPFDQIDKSEAESVAEHAANSEANSVAWSAAESVARYAESTARLVTWSANSVAWSAAESLRSAVNSVAWSAAASANLVAASTVWSTAKQDYYTFLKNTLFACIKETY